VRRRPVFEGNPLPARLLDRQRRKRVERAGNVEQARVDVHVAVRLGSLCRIADCAVRSDVPPRLKSVRTCGAARARRSSGVVVALVDAGRHKVFVEDAEQGERDRE